MIKECSVKVSEIRGRQWKLYVTELTENERTDIPTEKRLDHSLFLMLYPWKKKKKKRKEKMMN